MGLAVYAETFVGNGYAVLVFDYRRWGGSDGSPRNVLLVSEQLEDYRTGSSFSGGHVLQLASEDQEIGGAIIQCPFIDGIASALGLSVLPSLKVMPFAIYDIVRQARGFSPYYVPTVAPVGGFGVLCKPGTHTNMFQLQGASGDFPNQIQASAVFQFPLYRPGTVAKNIKCPVLVCVPESDNLCPPSATKKAVQTIPKGKAVTIRGGGCKQNESVVIDLLADLLTGHFDCYP
ncbi:hypothetical protein CTheo_2745 [Ceratobasidium theobromae]|uniref:Uncharacterized protein n=1 Tax=Ceratobasidium theobromae TaxID=1582974 RepID=A0A5N5QRH6_9AGAM|nr:hypothetical protein CTheo_2745 [Ceratobasidium theobromae]